MSTVVVTGASGFIGQALVVELVRRGITTVAVSRQSGVSIFGAKFVQVDDYSATPAPPDAVLVHLAEESALAATTMEIASRMDDVVKLLLTKPFRHVVYASTGMVYGDQYKRPCDPKDRPMGGGTHVVAKLGCERQVLDVGSTVVRLANVFGPRMTKGTVVDDILQQFPGDEPIRVRGLNSVRDFIWIDDVAAGLSDIVAGIAGGIFNLGSGIGHSVRDVAEVACQVMSQSGRGLVATEPKHKESSLVLDISRTTNAFGWCPLVSFEDGLKKIMRP